MIWGCLVWGQLLGPQTGAGPWLQSLAEADADPQAGDKMKGSAQWGHPMYQGYQGHPVGSCGARADTADPQPGLCFSSLSKAN